MKDNHSSESVKIITKVLIYIFVFLFAILFLRFFYIAAFGKSNGYNIDSFYENKYLRTEIIPAKRGNIYDRNGRSLALTLNDYKVYAIISTDNENHVTDIDEFSATISEYTACDADFYIEQFNKNPLAYQIEFGKCGIVNRLAKEELTKRNISGLDFYEHFTRFYPNDSYLSHIIGYTSYPDGYLKGTSGVEMSYNSMLTGKNGERTYMIDKYGDILPGSEKIIEAEHGSDIYLTIDISIQHMLETNAIEVWENTNAEAINATIVNGKTGEMLATLSYPSFNLNDNNNIINYDHVVSTAYEPGSIMKPYVYATAIDLDKYRGSNKFLSGSIVIGDTTIHDHNPSGWGYITYDEGLYYSSNVAIVKLLTQVINTNDFTKYSKDFGFASKTNIELPNEASGSLPIGNDFSMITSGFGQGMMSTPLQHIQAYSSFINGGKMIRPQIVNEIIESNGRLAKEYAIEVVGNPISESTSVEMSNLLYNSINHQFSVAKPFRIDGYEVMGKTGTAQIADSSGYIEGENYYSFIGNAYKGGEKPEYIMYVGVKNPDEEFSSAREHTAKIFTQSMKSVLEYYDELVNIETIYPEGIILKDYSTLPKYETTIELQKQGLTPVILGDGDNIVSQIEESNTKVYIGEKVFLYVGGNVRMPSLLNWSRHDIKNFAKLLNINVTFKGYGFVKYQSINAGSIIKSGDQLEITLEDV